MSISRFLLGNLICGLLTCLVASVHVHAETFRLSTDDSTLVGNIKVVIPSQDNTLLDVARQLDVGYHEITLANPGVDVWIPERNKKVLVPSRYILPPKPWTGIVVNISQRRLFYFPIPAKGQEAQVITFPVSIAREGWSTPLGTTKIVAKHKDPAWFVPKSIQAEHKKEGETEFPEYFPPGPNNPMGMLAIQLGFPGIYIHGTNRPWGVGMRTSHGCLHLYPEDAAVIFPLVSAGTPVRVIDEPFLVGQSGNQLYMASYEPVAEYGGTRNASTRAKLAVSNYIREDQMSSKPRFDVDWKKVDTFVEKYEVMPLPISPDGEGRQQAIDAVTPDIFDYPPYGMDANDASVPGSNDDAKGH